MNTLAIAQSEDEAQTSTGSVDFIISTDQDASAEALASLDALRSSLGIELVDQSCKFGFELWRAEDMPSDADWAAALTDPLCIQALEAIEYIQPNYTLTAADFSTTSISTDPMSDRQWALDNTGQTGGQTDADIDAPEAWTQATGEGVIVAVIDTGVDYTHADLDDNMWVNTGEIAGNGIDDDGNGYIDDVYGYDFANDDGDPLDSQGHGTHVAGTIAAEADNGIGVVGVAYDAQIMALQFFDDNGNGSTFDAILALEYAVLMGAQISNNSWGGGSYSTALAEAIAMAGDAGHLFVAAAGNDALNN
ncbi:MAG: S8 family peptidase, partial [Mangrovicoccus sp.]